MFHLSGQGYLFIGLGYINQGLKLPPLYLWPTMQGLVEYTMHV